jgi:hypothetical protein
MAYEYTPQPVEVDPRLLGNAQPNFSPWQRFGAAAQGFLGDRDLAMALLANSGYSPNKRSFGEVLGTSMLQSNQMKQQRAESDIDRRYREAQIATLGAKQPNSIEEYEYAKKQGYKGSFQDWTIEGGQSSRPSSVQEWEFYNKLPEDQKRLYLEMKRNPNFKVQDVMGAPTVVQGMPGGGVQTTALSTPQQETNAAAMRKGAESQAAAVGTGAGNIQAGIQAKGSSAETTKGMLDLADPLIDSATGSLVGAGADMVARAFGKSLSGDEAIAQLQVLQAGLMTNMPRMEGPQSDRDVDLYRQAAGQIGDPKVPREIKKAAVKTIRALQQKYADRASNNPNPTWMQSGFPNIVSPGDVDSQGWTTLGNGMRIREKR